MHYVYKYLITANTSNIELYSEVGYNILYANVEQVISADMATLAPWAQQQQLFPVQDWG